MPARPLASFFALFLAACALPHDDPATEERSDSVYVVWAAVPSTDGTKLSVVLEPRILHRDSVGVMVGDGSSDNAGDAAAIGVTSSVSARRLPPGRKMTLASGAAALVFTRDDYHDGLSALAMGPPWTPWRSVDRLDRDTLATTASIAFEPPLVRPRGLGDGRTLVDAPGSPISDAERDVDLVAYDLDRPGGARNVVFHARGFHAVSCAHGSGVAMAFEASADPTAVTVVSIAMDPATRTWKTATTSLAASRLDATGDAVCDADGRFVAFATVARDTDTHRVAVVDTTSVSPPFVVDSDERAYVLRPDGGALLLRVGKTLVLARPDAPSRPTSVTETTFAGATGVGGAAVVDASNGTHVIALDTGADVLVSPRRCSHVGADAKGTRAVCVATPDDSGSAPRDAFVFVVDLGATPSARDVGPVTLAEQYSSLAIATVAGDTAWLATDGERDADRFVAVDLRAARIVAQPPMPTCDTTAVTVSHACLP